MVKRQRADVHSLLDPFHEGVLIVVHAFGIIPLNLRQLRVDSPQFPSFDFLEAWILGAATNQIEVVAVGDAFRKNQLGQRQNLVQVVASNDRIDVNDQTKSE